MGKAELDNQQPYSKILGWGEELTPEEQAAKDEKEKKRLENIQKFGTWSTKIGDMLGKCGSAPTPTPTPVNTGGDYTPPPPAPSFISTTGGKITIGVIALAVILGGVVAIKKMNK